MANLYAHSGTLVANTEAHSTIRCGPFGLWVINRTGGGTEIWVRLDGTAATVAGDNCFCVQGARQFPTATGNVTVSLISSGTPSYEVSGSVVQT